MPNIKPFIYLLFTITLSLSCSDDNSTSRNLLLQAQNLLERDPQRALGLLDSIVSPQEMGEELYMQYIVTKVEAKRTNGLSIAADTIIFEAQRYFNLKEDAPKAVYSNFYAGSVSDESNAVDRTIFCYQQAINAGRKANNDLMVAKSYHTLGVIFYDNNLLDSAVINLNQALVFYNKTSNTDLFKMKALNNLGFIYDMTRQYDKAEDYFKQSFEIARLTGNKLYQGYGNQNLGLVCLDRKDYNNALPYFQKALPYMESTVDSIKIYLSLSKLYSETNKKDSALYYSNIIKTTLPDITDKRMLVYAYETLKIFYEKEGDYKEALRYSSLFEKQLQDINNQELIIQLRNAEAKREIAIHKEQSKAQQNILIVWAIASYIVLLLLAVCAFVYFIMRTKVSKQKKEKEKALAEGRDRFFQFNAGINYKIMNEWKEIYTKVIALETEMEEFEHEQAIYPRIEKTINTIHKKISLRLISLGKEFLLEEPNGKTALRYMKDQEILCMMLAYHNYPLHAIELILDKPVSQKDFQGTLWVIQSKLRQAKFTEERINELLHDKKKKHIS